jgi:hypothetical protein
MKDNSIDITHLQKAELTVGDVRDIVKTSRSSSVVKITSRTLVGG